MRSLAIADAFRPTGIPTCRTATSVFSGKVVLSGTARVPIMSAPTEAATQAESGAASFAMR